MTPIVVLALSLAGGSAAGAPPNPPGTLITVTAMCTANGYGGKRVVTATAYMVVRSPLAGSVKEPVYLCQGWKRTAAALSGSRASLPCGLLVRFPHRGVDGRRSYLEGLQLADGRVLVNGALVQRED